MRILKQTGHIEERAAATGVHEKHVEGTGAFRCATRSDNSLP